MPLFKLIPLLSFILILWQIICLNMPKKWRIVLFLLFCCGIAYIPLGIAYKFGSMVPYWLVIIQSLLTATSIIFISIGALRLFAFFFSLVMALFSKKGKQLCKALFKSPKISLYSLALALILGPFAFYGAAKNPSIKYYDFAYKDLPQELDGYRIAHISDTHSGVLFREQWHEELVEKIMAEKTDLIVHTGDIGDGLPHQIEKSIAPFLELSAPDGVYYVMGNHENYYSINAWRGYYKSKNLTVLENEYRIHDSLPLIIAGAAAEARTKPINYEKLLAHSPEDAFILLLDHYPNRANEAKNHVDLQLSGHTHGGTTFYLAPFVAKFNGGFVNGLYNLGDMKLFVTSCAGLWSYAPLRLFVPSEIAIIRLVKG